MKTADPATTECSDETEAALVEPSVTPREIVMLRPRQPTENQRRDGLWTVRRQISRPELRTTRDLVVFFRRNLSSQKMPFSESEHCTNDERTA
jgi:hypothetical protein